MKNINGDVLLGKTFTLDPISKRRIINRGEEDQYYIKDHHQEIVTKEVFDRAQEILQQRSKCRDENRIRGNYSKIYPFSSKLYCGYCGKYLSRRNINSGRHCANRIWQCTTSVKKGKTYCENSKLIREDILENAFIETYNLLMKNSKGVINKFIQRVENSEIIPNSEKKIKKLEKNIDDLKKKISNLLDLLTDEVISKESYTEKVKEYEKRLSKEEQKRDALLMEQNNNDIMSNGIYKIKELFKENNKLEKFDADLFETVVKYAIIGKDDAPYNVCFVLRNGRGIARDTEECDKLTILEYCSNQKFFVFEKDENNRVIKKQRIGLNISVEIEY